MDWLHRIRSSRFTNESDQAGEILEPLPLDEGILDELRRKFPMPKFFLFGYPRSGTTLLMRLLSLHPEIHCNRQAHLFTYPRAAAQALSDQEIRDWLGRGSNRWSSGKGLESAVIRLVADFILEREAESLGKQIVGDKSPTVIGGLAVRRLQAVYPDARLIYLVRDGRDTAVSRRFQRFIDQPQLLTSADRQIKAELARNSQQFSSDGRSIFTPSFLQEEAASWSKNLSEIDSEGRALFQDRFLSLRYEDLLADPKGEMQKLWEFLQAPASFPGDAELIREKLDYNPGAEDQARKEDALVSNVRRGGAGGWQSWFTGEDRKTFKATAGETLLRWGYTGDSNW